MKAITLQITYRQGRPFAAYIHLAGKGGRGSARSQHMGGEIVVDFDGDDRPVGLEIINPDVTPLDEIFNVFDRLGLERPDEKDLGPLVA